MVSHFIIDKWYLTISFLITLAWQLTGFAIAWTFKFDKITDFTGGSNFFILALITMLTGPYETRNKVASAMMMGWAARLALFLLFRVLKTGSDNRFDEIRSKFWSFAGFWAGQILWVWIVAFPIVTVNSPGVSDRLYGGRRVVVGAAASDIVGIVLFAIGFLVESISDIQKYMYKSSNPPKGKPCDKGLWKWCRHPPYFGEILVHWGLWIFVMGVTWDDPSYVSGSVKAVQYAGIISPVFTMLLLFFLSGLPTAEKPTAKKHYLASHEVPGTNTFSPPKPTSDSWENYKEYLSRTSIVIPIPPKLYKPLPEWFKRTVLLDFPMYRFDEDKDGKEALEEQRKKRAEESDA